MRERNSETCEDREAERREERGKNGRNKDEGKKQVEK
jgi:hypothetical protein